MAKDRAAPFSRKHRSTWLPITGGMIVIGIVNVGIGIYLYTHGPKDAPRKHPVEPRHLWGPAVDAGAPDAAEPPPTPR